MGGRINVLLKQTSYDMVSEVIAIASDSSFPGNFDFILAVVEFLIRFLEGVTFIHGLEVYSPIMQHSDCRYE